MAQQRNTAIYRQRQNRILRPLPVASFPLIFRRRSFSGLLIGGLPETQEMLDFCGQHNLTCDTEMIRTDEINTIALLRRDGGCRFSQKRSPKKYFKIFGVIGPRKTPWTGDTRHTSHK
jgi:hypothetical protein